MIRLKMCGYSALFCAMLSTSGVAIANSAYLQNFEISASGGINWLSASDAKLVISPNETDGVQANHTTTTWVGRIGVGYNFFANLLRERDYFNNLLVELNLYRSSSAISGEVNQYERAEFNNYIFQAPVKSTRLMLDFKPNLYTHDMFSSYGILGVGQAWNRLSYNEAVSNSQVDPNSYTELNAHNTSGIAYDVGLGLRANITEELSMTLEYLYSYLGSASASNVNTGGIVIQKTPHFTIQAQSLLLGLNWSF